MNLYFLILFLYLILFLNYLYTRITGHQTCTNPLYRVCRKKERKWATLGYYGLNGQRSRNITISVVRHFLWFLD